MTTNGALTPAQPILAQPHLPELDGIRGIAILLVTVVHLGSSEVDPDLGTDGVVARVYSILSTHGTSGVGLFFVLSGYLITKILLKERGKPNYFSNFYARRTLRIFPLYYLSIALALFVLAPFVLPAHPSHQPLVEHQAWLWAYSSNVPPSFGWFKWRAEWLDFSHFWSLAVEEHFYLVWPAVVTWLSDRQILRVCAFVAALAVLLKVAFLYFDLEGGAYMFTLCRADGLTMGAVLAIWSTRFDAPVHLRRWGFLLTACSFPVLLLLGLQYITGRLWWTPAVTHSAYAFFWAGALAMVLSAPMGSGVSRVLGTPVLRFFGRYSYGLYVWHGLAVPTFCRLVPIESFRDATGSRLVALFIFYAISLSISCAAAYASWHLFEKHFVRLKQRFS